jgi:hypothetical protein
VGDRVDGGGDGARTRRGEGRPLVPHGELTDAWPPHGVRGLAWSGRCARALALAQALAGWAGSLGWAERMAQA